MKRGARRKRPVGRFSSSLTKNSYKIKKTPPQTRVLRWLGVFENGSLEEEEEEEDEEEEDDSDGNGLFNVITETNFEYEDEEYDL